jgi:lysylphosphatidylglycerol synthetase-like protein (DUF2156 family)
LTELTLPPGTDRVSAGVAALAQIDLPVGGRALVVPDLRLGAGAQTARQSAVVRAVESWTGPGALVFNGNTFDFPADHGCLAGGRVAAGAQPAAGMIAASLEAHSQLVETVRAFAGSSMRRVVILPGERDACLAWSALEQESVETRLGAQVALAVDLNIDTVAGARRVRIEVGHHLDGPGRRDGPHPADSSPAGRVRAEVTRLTDPLGHRGQVPSGPPPGEAEHEHVRDARDRGRVLIASGYAGLITGQTNRPELVDLGNGFLASAATGDGVVRGIAAGLTGMRLPSMFVTRRQVPWVEVEAGNELYVRLLYARRPGPGATVIEQLVARRGREPGSCRDLHPQLVATCPRGRSWPEQPSGRLRRRRTRRLAALFVGVAGLISLVSALSEPLRDRLHLLREVVPIAVPEAATALTALAAVGLLVLARGVRRGQRRAWAVTLTLLATAIVGNLVKGVDFEEAAVAAAAALYLWANRTEFQAPSEAPTLRRNLALWGTATGITIVAGAVAVEFGALIRDLARPRHPYRPHDDRHYGRFSIGWERALQASAERMIGAYHVQLPLVMDRFFNPAMGAVSVGLGLALAVMVFRPVVAHGRHGERPDQSDLARARDIVSRHGSGTLDYFALRSDKQFFFWGDTVVAYAVYGGVCLMSPDPVGPRREREPAWRAFCRFVDERGWVLGALGAAKDWLPIYRATGMHDLYAGDEGVVRTGPFTLEGGRFKSLRQAVNRIAKYGYRISFHDPACLDPDLRASLEVVMAKSRRGGVERGFSMTLGRAFDPDDEGLLLAVVHAPTVTPAEGGPGTDAVLGTDALLGTEAGLGEAVAFCQFVPAPGIGGYSLDLMRRDNAKHPNGVIDFAVVETVRYLSQRGAEALSLNFATMRAVLAGEAGKGSSKRLQAWLLRRMGDSMQIESLWKFNAKFDPDWQPRYVLYDAPENALSVAVAIARAESWWELPIIGRFLVPSPVHGGGNGRDTAGRDRCPLGSEDREGPGDGLSLVGGPTMAK